MAEHDGHRERMRKQFLTHGMDALRDYEVLELLLFYAIPRKDTRPIARKLLEQFGSIAGVLEASPQALQAAGPLSENAAILLHLIAPLCRRYLLSRTDKGVILSNTKDCGRYLIPYFFGETEELVYLLCLDAKNKLLGCQLLHRGSINSVTLSIRRAAETAMACHASTVILAHNHPSGLALPSDSDYQTTDLLKNALAPLDIVLADHIIVADDDYVSLRDNGYLRD